MALALLSGALGYGAYVAWHMWQVHRLRDRADSALRTGDFAKAVPPLQELLALRPNHPETLLALGQVERRRGRFDAATGHYRAYLNAGGIAEAVALEKDLRTTQSGNLRHEQRLRLYVANDHPETDLILEALAQGYLLNFHLNEAVAALDQLLTRQPGLLPARYWRGQALLRMRNFEEAAVAFRGVVERDPSHEEARVALADCLLVIAQPQEARTHYAWLAAKRGSDPSVHAGLAKACFQLGELPEARRHAEAALALDAGRVDALLVRGQIEMQLERPGDAEPWLRRAAEHVPHERDAVHNYIQCLVQLDQRAEAKQWQDVFQDIDRQQKRLSELTAQIRSNPHNASLRAEVGKIFLDIGNEVEGVRWLESALRVDPGHAVTHRLLADLRRKKDAQE
ncbi:MAG: tetratricopeptide repeat protein [Gemmataceae bacterium]|nr:tetratricopeptide repeat protein [Gemmataceae bacterium]